MQNKWPGGDDQAPGNDDKLKEDSETEQLESNTGSDQEAEKLENEDKKTDESGAFLDSESADSSLPTKPESEVEAETEETTQLPSDGEEILKRLDHILELIENRLAYDTAKEKLVSRLDDELRGYRENAERKKMRPLLMDLIHFYDSLENINYGLWQREDLKRSDVKEALKMVFEELQEVLARQNVCLFDEDERAIKLDRRLHRTLELEKTSIPEEDNMVAKTIRKGFKWDDEIIRAEEVIIKKYDPQNSEDTGGK